MYSKELVDSIRLAAAQHELHIPMTRGRDLVSLLLVGRHYSAAIAAVRAGKIPPINMEADRVAGLRLQYGPIVDDLKGVKKISDTPGDGGYVPPNNQQQYNQQQ
jgi:hypothetical protein